MDSMCDDYLMIVSLGVLQNDHKQTFLCGKYLSDGSPFHHPGNAHNIAFRTTKYINIE
jgi:hypothetical protein